MTDRQQRGSRVRGVLEDVLKRIDPDHRLKAFEVWNFWNEIVGETVARRAQPSGFRNGVLFVTVSAHTWLQELQFMKHDLLERLNNRLGGPMVRDIYFVSGAIETAPASESPRSATPTDPPPARKLVLPEIRDKELANAFERVVRAHVRRTPGAPERRRRSKDRR